MLRSYDTWVAAAAAAAAAAAVVALVVSVQPELLWWQVARRIVVEGPSRRSSARESHGTALSVASEFHQRPIRPAAPLLWTAGPLGSSPRPPRVGASCHERRPPSSRPPPTAARILAVAQPWQSPLGPSLPSLSAACDARRDATRPRSRCRSLPVSRCSTTPPPSQIPYKIELFQGSPIGAPSFYLDPLAPTNLKRGANSFLAAPHRLAESPRPLLRSRRSSITRACSSSVPVRATQPDRRSLFEFSADVGT